ncbi:FAD/NAD(P)-binding protein [Inquilinus limosus]|uniref:FAD/NAD(P)-binding protein n=1 Tax=Inquilinus limosus TaxID=171674 RepID=UPI003F1911AF
MRVAVVGAGPTAVALMEGLARARGTVDPGAFLDVTVFDPTPHPWCGQSFAPDRPEALTNTYTPDLSVRHWEPEHVNDWCRANGYAEFAGENFAPRSLIGRYLQDAARQAAARMDAFAFVREPVTGVTLTGERVRVDTPTGHDVFDYAVLSMGRATVHDPYGLAGQEKFRVSPYPLQDTLGEVDPDEHIGIIGCGLTAVDLIAALKADRHRGRITLLSRRGLLPAVRPSPVRYSLRHFTVSNIEGIAAAKGKVTLQDLVRLLYEDLDHAGASRRALVDEIFPADYGLDRLRRQLACVDDGETAYSIALKSIVACQDAWYLLDTAGRDVVSRFRHIYSSLCCPMPRHRAADILDLAGSGQLEVVRGLQSVAKGPDGRFVAISANPQPLHFDRVFSAASELNAIDPMAEPIINGLLRSGQARAHPFGGLDVERTTSRLLDARNHPQPRLYAVGTTTIGAFQALNGYIVLRRYAVQIADSILAHHRARYDPRPRLVLTRATGRVIAGATD